MNSRLPEGVWQHPVKKPPNMAARRTNAKTFFIAYTVKGIASGASVAHICLSAAR
jgi:hypothetical protein